MIFPGAFEYTAFYFIDRYWMFIFHRICFSSKISFWRGVVNMRTMKGVIQIRNTPYRIVRGKNRYHKSSGYQIVALWKTGKSMKWERLVSTSVYLWERGGKWDIIRYVILKKKSIFVWNTFFLSPLLKKKRRWKSCKGRLRRKRKKDKAAEKEGERKKKRKEKQK